MESTLVEIINSILLYIYNVMSIYFYNYFYHSSLSS